MQFDKLAQNLLTRMWPKLKPTVEFQDGGRLFSKPEALVSQLWISVEKQQILM